MTDHRIGFTSNGVDRVMEGEGLETIVAELVSDDEKNRLDVFLKKLVSKSSS